CYSFWAPGGTGEESESLIGRWLRTRGDRDRFVLATKVGARPEPAPAARPAGAEGLSAPVIRAQTEASLRRLGTDRIDVLYAHVGDPATPQEEALAAFIELVCDGPYRLRGCSNTPSSRIA